MKYFIIPSLFVSALWAGGVTKAQNIPIVRLPDAHIIVHVNDEDRRGVPDSIVGVAGTISPKPGSETFKKALTDPTGKLDVQVKSNGEIHVAVDKAEYYRTEIDPAYSYEDRPGAFETAVAKGRWQPDPITIKALLKQIANPIPMYARRVNRAVPSQNEDLGFDMFAGDFVTPYGRGKTSDMIFRLEVTERAKKDYDYKLNVAFPNTPDGILPFNPTPHLQGSALRSPYGAPDRGFLPTWTVTRSRRPGTAENSNYDPEKHGYFFRIRSSVDKTGKILSANYGKIYGDFMNFTYYLNPAPNDRNVEFDPKRNLFTNLKPEERVTMP
jgi:hypothetical protein